MKNFAVAVILVWLVYPSAAFSATPITKSHFRKINEFGSVEVIQSPGVDTLGLFVNGRLSAWLQDTSGRKAHYPLILAESVGKVLILGLGRAHRPPPHWLIP